MPTVKPKLDEQDRLVEGLRNLDPGAVDDFVHHYSRPLFGVILNYTKNPSDTEEILQDTLLKVIGKIDTFRNEGDIWPWIKKIAINNSIMWLRKNRGTRHKEVRLEGYFPSFNDDDEFQSPIYKWAVDPEEVILNSEMGDYLHGAVQSLPFEYRVPLVLRDVEGLSIKHISSFLGLKEATTKTRIHRARLFVRQKLNHYFEGRS